MSVKSTAPLAAALGVAAAFALAPSATATPIEGTLECDSASVTSVCAPTGLAATAAKPAGSSWDVPMSNPAYWGSSSSPNAPIWVYD